MTIPPNPFEPQNDYLLVENLLRREVNIIMPGDSKPESVYGFYISKIGPGRQKDDGTFVKVPEHLKVGDEVILNNGACIAFTHPRTGTGERARKFVFVRPADVLAVVEPEEEMDAETKAKIFSIAQ